MRVCMYLRLFVYQSMDMQEGACVRASTSAMWITKNLHETYKQRIQKHVDLPDSHEYVILSREMPEKNIEKINANIEKIQYVSRCHWDYPRHAQVGR